MSTESVADFRARAKTWLAKNMPMIDSANPPVFERDCEATCKLQRRLHDGGFAGIGFPRAPTADRGVSFNQVRCNTQEG